MGTTITFRRGDNDPTSGSGLTLAEPAFNTTLKTFHIGLGYGITAAWVGAPISGASADIAAGITYKIPSAAAVKNYVTDYVTAVNGVLTVNGFAGGVTLNAGTAIGVTSSSGNITVTNLGVQSFNGLTGAVGGVCAAQANTFTALQSFANGISASGITVNGNMSVTGNFTVSGGVTFTTSETVLIEDNIITLNSNVTGSPSENAGMEIERGTSANVQLLWNESSDRWTFTNDGSTYYDLPTSVVTSFNGLTGAVQGVSSAAAGTGISVSAATGAVTITNTGVQSFNGRTGAVTGASLGANTFTGLNSFNAGISSYGGTFSDQVQFTSGLSASQVRTLNLNGNGTLSPSFTDGQFRLTQFFGTYTTVAASGSTDRTITLPDDSGTVALTSQLMGAVNGSTAATTAVTSFNGRTGAVQGVSSAAAGTGISVSGATGAVTITNTGVQSFNGLTGAVQGVSSAAAGTGISVSGTTGAVTITNIGVQSFNGATGAVIGVSSVRGLTGAVGLTNGSGIGLSVSGQTLIFSNTGVLSFNGLTGAVTGASLGANTFTELNTFNAGISVSGGATFASTVRIVGTLSGTGATFSGGVSAAAFNGVAINTGNDTFSNTSLAIGAFALASNNGGYNNTAVGFAALSLNTTGTENAAFGESALTNCTTGSSNVAFGAGTLYENTFGSFNLAIGAQALNFMNGGNRNTAIGSASLQNGSTGSDQIGIGYRAGSLVEGGLRNVAIGNEAMLGTATPVFYDCVSVGYRSLYSMSAAGASFNTAIGTESMRQTTSGSRNTGVGSNSLRSITTANEVIGIGADAGRYRGATGTTTLTTGTGGIYIGVDSRASGLAQTNEIVIGRSAVGLGSNTAVIGATAQTAAYIYGLVHAVGGVSAPGGTFSSLTQFTAGISAAGGMTLAGSFQGSTATFSGLGSFSAGLSAAGTTAATFNGTVNMGFNTLFQPTLRYYNEVVAYPTISGGGLTLDISSAQVFGVTLDAGVNTLSITNTPTTANRSIGFTLILTADGTARGITWGAAVKWANNDPPALTITNGKRDIFTFMSPDGGTNWYAFIAGLNF